MGYDIQITRKQDWADEEGPVITPDEWLALVAADPQLFIEDESEPYFAVWPSLEDAQAWLDLDEEGGYLFAKNPDDEFLAKMHEVAAHLKAKVQGQDGEVY